MTDQSTEQKSRARSSGPGSLQRLGFGALTMQKLGQLVNWSNSSDHKPPEFIRWIDIPESALTSAASETTETVASSQVQAVDAPPASVKEDAAALAEQAAQTMAAQKVAEQQQDQALAEQKLAAEQIAEQKQAAEKIAAEKLAAEKLAAEKLAAERFAAERLAAEKLAAEKLAVEKQAAVKQAAEGAATEQARLAARAAVEQQAAREEAESGLAEQQKLAQEKATQEKAAQEKAAQEKAAQERAEQEKAEQVKAAQELAARQTAAAAEKRPERAEPLPKPSATVSGASHAPTTERTSTVRAAPVVQPTNHSVPAALPPVSMPTPRTRSSHEDTELEEYVARLERLVLELNMELGRRADRAGGGDTLADLSQRIIDLNLQNMALREQLHSPGSPR